VSKFILPFILWCAIGTFVNGFAIARRRDRFTAYDLLIAIISGAFWPVTGLPEFMEGVVLWEKKPRAQKER
jgi:hypothetical protein